MTSWKLKRFNNLNQFSKQSRNCIWPKLCVWCGERERSTWHIRWNSPSSGWMPKSPDASRGTLPNRPFALCKNILWPRKHKLVDMFWNNIQKAQLAWGWYHILVSCSSTWITFSKIANLNACMNYTMSMGVKSYFMF